MLAFCPIFKQKEFIPVSEPLYLLTLFATPRAPDGWLCPDLLAQLLQEMSVFLIITSCVTILLPANHILSCYPALFS